MHLCMGGGREGGGDAGGWTCRLTLPLASGVSSSTRALKGDQKKATWLL